MNGKGEPVPAEAGAAGPAPRVLVFLKAPRPGTVKTRLAGAYGAEGAARIYRLLAGRQMAAFPDGWPVEVLYAPADARAEMEEWLGDRARLRPQAGGDLGERLERAVAAAFAEGAGPVVCVGADCPDLGAEDFERAAALLAGGADLVFGPAEDGGYYLVALARECPEIFRGVSWGGSRTLAQSLRRAGEAGRRVALLGEKADVDLPADWERVRDRWETEGDAR